MIAVSIIIPAYNAAAYLERCIRSALDQVGADLEVIVIDDVSTDATRIVAEGFARRDPRVSLIEAERNGGPGLARNLGIGKARGEWVAILDADDAFHPDRLRTLLSLAERYGADIVSDNLLMVSDNAAYDGKPLFPPDRISGEHVLTAPEFILGNISRRSGNFQSFGLLKPMFRRAFLAQHDISYPAIRFAEDFILDTECLGLGATWAITEAPLYLYSIRLDSLTYTATTRDLRNLIQSERKLVRTARQHRWPSDLRSVLGKHLRSVEDACAWRSFAEAVKTRRVAEACAAAVSGPRAPLHIMSEALRCIDKLRTREDLRRPI